MTEPKVKTKLNFITVCVSSRIRFACRLCPIKHIIGGREHLISGLLTFPINPVTKLGGGRKVVVVVVVVVGGSDWGEGGGAEGRGSPF